MTFDDGGSDAQVRSILATLQDNNVRGRFFFTGSWAASNPALMDRIVGDGHLLANHTYSHPPLSESSAGEVADQIRRGVAATTTPKLLRPPFAAGALTTRLEALAREQGYVLCRWTMDTYDWDEATAAQMAERVTHGDYRTPPVAAGGNILMHGGGRYTASGLQQIIDAVRAKGLVLDPLRFAPDRTHTAAAISPYRHPDGADKVYVATGADFPDALAGGPAAAAVDDAPILLVAREHVPRATVDELDRLAPNRVVVLGGRSVVGDAVVRSIRERTGAAVDRIHGADRFATAAETAGYSHPDGAGIVFVATGASFPDALAAGPTAAGDRAPILLVTVDTVPQPTADEVERLAPARIIVLGGAAAVSDATAQRLADISGAEVHRLWR